MVALYDKAADARRDHPVIQGVILVIVVIYLAINLIVDLSYRFFNRGLNCNEPRHHRNVARAFLRAPSHWPGFRASGDGDRRDFCVVAGALRSLCDPSHDPPHAAGCAHWFGTNQYGRDTLSRAIYSSRMALAIGAGVVSFALFTGIPIGVFSALFPRLGHVLMRMVDVLMAFPSLLLALGLIVVLGPSAPIRSSPSAPDT